MSESFFDNLARTLASPMPRRRAVRVLGTAVVVAALPGLRPRSALARSNITCTPGKTELCEKNAGTQVCMPLGGTCCIFGPESGYDGGLLVGCAKGTRCGSGKLGDRCVCDEHWDAEGNCVNCDETDKCGKNCCKKGQYCASKNRSLCCGDASGGSPMEQPCLVPRSPEGICCKPGTECKQNAAEAKCCRPNEVLRNGGCACRNPKQKLCGGKECCDEKSGEVCTNGKCCPKGKTGCGGTDCCEKGETCSKGKCCPKGKVNCGGDKCCAEVDCCGKTCCEGDTVCTNGKCCPPGRGFGSGKGARCCPPGTIPIDSGAGLTQCCPPNDPACCDGGDSSITPLCRKGQTCVKGGCVKL